MAVVEATVFSVTLQPNSSSLCGEDMCCAEEACCNLILAIGTIRLACHCTELFTQIDYKAFSFKDDDF